MSFSAFGDGEADDALAEINMIPLIDVMLVLLVIFMVAAPLLTHAVAVELPRADAPAASTITPPVHVAIDRVGHVYWNNELLPFEQLRERMQIAAAQQPAPELQLRAARSTPYERVAQVLAAATDTGLTRVGFVTNPDPES